VERNLTIDHATARARAKGVAPTVNREGRKRPAFARARMWPHQLCSWTHCPHPPPTGWTGCTTSWGKSSPSPLHGRQVLAVLKPNRIIRKRTEANCSSFHLRVFLGLSNPQGQRQTTTISIPRDNFGERKAKFNLEVSRTTQMQLNKCIHVP
jgi:hypothetical protein